MADVKVGFTPNQTGALVPIDEVVTLTRGGSSDAEMFRVSVETARRFPRKEDAIVAHLLETLDAFPQFAHKAIFSIKYNQGKANETKVEGLTIRAAETIAAAWGNLLVRAEILNEDENGFDLQAGVFDMQSNYRWVEPGRASKWLKRRDGRMELLDDRGQLQARGSAVSKVTRNAILRILPLHVKAAFELRVREKMAGGDLTKPADKARVTAAIEAFAEAFKVTEAQLAAYVGKPRDVWVGDDLADLRGLYNALEAGETTLAEAFPPVEVAPTHTPTGTVVSAQEGMLGSAAPRLPQDAPATPPKVDIPAPKPIVAQAPVAAPQPDELARLRAALAEAEAKLAQAPAVVLVTEVPEKAPDPIFDRPAPVKTAAPTSEDTDLAALAQQAEACTTIEALDQLLGRMYAPGGTLEKAARGKKQAVLRLIGARRDALQAAQG